MNFYFFISACSEVVIVSKNSSDFFKIFKNVLNTICGVLNGFLACQRYNNFFSTFFEISLLYHNTDTFLVFGN